MALKKQFIKFIIPSVVSMWVFSIYSMIDGIFVAKGVGETALAAVNLSIPYISLIFALALLFAVGTSTLAAVYSGQGDHDQASRIFSLNTAVLLIVSVLIMIFSSVFLDSIISLLGATDITRSYVKDYLGVIILFVPFYMLSYSLEVIIKTDGFPVLATLGVLVSILVNGFLDYLFILVFHLGIRGAGLAAGCAQLSLFLLFFIHFLKKKGYLRFTRFRWNLSVYHRILPIGVSDFITELSNGMIIFLFNHVILSVVGDSGVVGYTVVSYVNSLVLMTMMGITQGMQPLSSFYYGQREHGVCQRLLRYSVLCIAVCSLVAFAVGMLLPEPLVGIFIQRQHTELFAYSVRALRLFSFSFLIMGFNVVIAGFFVSIERPAYSMPISISRGLILISASLLVLSALFGETGIWLSTLVSESLCLCLTLALFFKYRSDHKAQIRKAPSAPSKTCIDAPRM
ncbi:MAG TPA: MATE family efflux transporter [Clostridia bacterium]|nr:MATE family efflux transporter [Clostridia bacterium]